MKIYDSWQFSSTVRLLTGLVALLSSSAISQSAIAETAPARDLQHPQSHPAIHHPLQFTAPSRPPTASGGRPARRVDLGSRSPCGDNVGYLTALLPHPDVTTQLLTLSARPSVAVYVPYGASSIQAMTFELWRFDSTGQLDYELTLPLTPAQQPGVIYVALPETAPPLTVDHTYNWSLSVSCEDPDLDSDPLSVTGTLQRVAPSPQLEQALAAANTAPNTAPDTARTLAAVYARSGIWYDALATLGQLYQAEPENIAVANDWASLLSVLDIDLSDLGIQFTEANISASSPIECCSPQ
ncbi:MAG: DUF928 domain-containing protein [Cyanobacteria bacterium P01_A01_bin.105]